MTKLYQMPFLPLHLNSV